MNDLAKQIARNLLADDPEVEARIQRGIAEHRQGSGEIELVGADGKPVERATVELKQCRHEFHFGCNGFMHKQFKDAVRDDAFDAAFVKLFNLAVLPFYWSDLEPEDGRPRFAKDSPYVYRRPPPDALLEFCEANHIVPKGHPLAWHQFLPKWLPLDQPAMAARLEQRIAELAARYGQRIRIWDVCNEAIYWDPRNVAQRMPERHVELAFELAAKYFPRTTTLTYNDFACWDNHGDYTAFYMLGRHLQGLNVNLGGLGLQYHMFRPKLEDLLPWAERELNPRYLFAILDQYGKLGLPLNVSEITVTGRADLGDGPAFQREVSERLYRLWFSHPATNGIIWWNLVDDTAYVDPEHPTWNENRYKGGLLHADLSPKPAYEALYHLIKQEWHTRVSLDYEHGGANRFRGFYGDYEAVVKTAAGTFTKPLRLVRKSLNKFKLELA